MRRSILFTALIALCTASCGSTPTAAVTTPEPRDVKVVSVRHEALNQTVTVSGTLAAEEQAVLSFKIPGILQALLVDLGSRVTAGQTVARLEPTDLRLRVAQSEAALQQARARLGLTATGDTDQVDPVETSVARQAKAVLDEARLTRDRLENLFQRGISARSELESAEAALQVADSRYQDALEEVRNRQALLAQRRSELGLAREQLIATELTVPFDGMIRERTASTGQYVSAGGPIATLVRIDPLRLRLEIPEREAIRVSLGQSVGVTVEGDQISYEGRVARLSPAIAEDSRTLLVEAEVRNREAKLRPGSFARAEIVTKADAPALLVPTRSVVTFAGIDKVLAVASDKAVEKRVQLGRREGEFVEIIQGLDGSELIVAEPGNLVDGQAVRVSKP